MKAFLIISIVGLTLAAVKGQTNSLNNLDSAGKKDGKWTVYYNAKGKEVSDSTQAVYYRFTWYEHGKNLYPFDWCRKHDKLISSSDNEQSAGLKLLDGEYKIIDKKGILKSIHVFNKGEYISIRNFYPTGELKEYCNFTNQHFQRGEFQPHSYCRRLYKKNGEVTYYYRRNPLIYGLRSFDDSDFDSTAVTNKRVIGDSIFATVTSYVGNQPRRQVSHIFFKKDNGENETMLHGTFTFWYRNGQKMEEGQYDHNKPVGEWKYWHKDGAEIKASPDFSQLNRTDENGEKTGWWIMYLDGNLKRLKDSVGATHCMYNYYTAKFYHFKYGNALGSKKYPVHFPESDTLKIGDFNLLNGDYITNYENGNILSVLSAKNGVLTEFKNYYPDGKLQLHLIYSNECGSPIRICIKEYDKNGKVKYEGANAVPQDLKKYRNT